MDIKVIDYKEFKTYPTASGIEFFDDKVYIIGDDATNILVKSKKWKLEKKIHLFESPSHRIPTLIRSDLEATTIVQVDKNPKLLMLGSGAKELYRNKAILLDLTHSTTEEFDLHIFYNRLKEAGLHSLNIEGAASVEDKIILSNRSEEAHTIVVTSNEFWKNQQESEIMLLKLNFDDAAGQFKGLAGLTYSPVNDWIVFTTSGKEKESVKDQGDAKPGDSFLGIIENASRKIGRKKLKVNTMINLSKENAKFKENQIQAVCIQRDKNKNLKLHLISTNREGKTCLFKIRIKD